MGNWDQFDDEEEDEAFRDAMEMAEAVKDGWGAREQLEACLAVAEAALLSKAAKAQRREQAEEERRREARERAMAAQREQEEREAREIVAAREREALRVRREREGRQPAVPATPARPSAEELRRREREGQVAAEERAAKVRLANAQAAEIEAKAELMRAQARAAARAAASVAAGGERRAQPTAPPEPRAPASADRVPRAAPGRREPRTALQMAVKAPVADIGKAAPGPHESPIEAADRAALMSIGRWPPPPTRPDSPFWTADADWPADWTLTGYDLAIFRGHLNVSQAVFAGQVGVPTVEIARAEAKPRAKVRPALQVAVRAAMEAARKVREPRRAVEVVGTARASTVAAGPGGPPAEGSVAAPGTAAPERAGLTGADLARWRAAAGLTQREASAKLGVAHGTVAKAELAPSRPLGEQLVRALHNEAVKPR